MPQSHERHSSTGFLVRVALLAAVIAVMAFTPLGYFRTGFLSITLLPIPVVIGAIVLGPTAGAILGAVFGVTSVIQCFGLESFGTTLMGINPVGTLITCMIPRILMGFLTGVLFLLLRRLFGSRFGVFAAACLAGPLLNTLLFMTSLCVFFLPHRFYSGPCQRKKCPRLLRRLRRNQRRDRNGSLLPARRGGLEGPLLDSPSRQGIRFSRQEKTAAASAAVFLPEHL